MSGLGPGAICTQRASGCRPQGTGRARPGCQPPLPAEGRAIRDATAGRGRSQASLAPARALGHRPVWEGGQGAPLGGGSPGSQRPSCIGAASSLPQPGPGTERGPHVSPCVGGDLSLLSLCLQSHQGRGEHQAGCPCRTGSLMGAGVRPQQESAGTPSAQSDAHH